MHSKELFLFIILTIGGFLNAQNIDSLKYDTLKKLPFRIATVKKLPPEELIDKKEGNYFAGLPEFSSDPINGFGYGAEGSIIFNGKRANPFFEYTPYLTKIDVAVFNTSKNQREVSFKLDKPYIFKSKWRLRAEMSYEINPNLLYFGINKNTLNTIGKLSQQDSVPKPVYIGNSYKGYENSLVNQYQNYNNYTKEEFILNISGEYALMDSKMRILAGFEMAKLNITSNATLSRLRNDEQNKSVVGFGHSLINFLQAGIVYDTRDLEPDPTHGVFAEITNEFSSKFIASSFNLDKLFAQIKYYKRLFPHQKIKMILATRLGMGYTFGNAPFFEYQDEWSSEGSIEGLGGPNTLRGYKQSRFLDRGMYFSNIELRTRFYKTKFIKQVLDFSAVPLFDFGSVYNQASEVLNTSSIRYSEGIGLRIAWNISTVLRFDYAISKEDKQFFFNFSHAF